MATAMETSSHDVELLPLGGGRIGTVAPLFTPDSKFVITAVGQFIKVYNLRSQRCVRLLEGHQQPVTDLAINPLNQLQLISTSKDGSIRVWDYQDAVCLKTAQGQTAITQLLGFADENTILVALKQQTALVVKQVSMSALQDTDIDALEPCWSCEQARTIAWHANANCLIAVRDKQIVVTHLTAKWTTELPCEQQMTTLACHPLKPVFASGDVRGAVTIWLDALSPVNAGNRLTTTLHWHSHEVTTLAYNRQGDYLLSGGHESVLVIWQTSTRTPRFLPRLGGTLLKLAVSRNDTLYGVSDDNNNIKILDASTLDPVCVIRGLQSEGAQAHRRLYPGGLQLDPRSQQVVLNGNSTHLQFYDPKSDEFISSVPIIQRNRVRRFRGRLGQHSSVQLPQGSYVSLFAFAHDGLTMVTVEERRDVRFGNDVRLKFWQYRPDLKSFMMTTLVDPPHSQHVNAIASDPSQARFATASDDGTLKLWSLDATEDAHRWACQACLSYKDLPFTACAFSSDGSILAAGTSSGTIVLFDTFSLAVLRVVLVTNKQPIKTVGFLSGTSSFVGSTGRRVVVVDLLTGETTAAFDGEVTFLAVHPTAAKWVVLSAPGKSKNKNKNKNKKNKNGQPGQNGTMDVDVEAPTKRVAMLRAFDLADLEHPMCLQLADLNPIALGYLPGDDAEDCRPLVLDSELHLHVVVPTAAGPAATRGVAMESVMYGGTTDVHQGSSLLYRRVFGLSTTTDDEERKARVLVNPSGITQGPWATIMDHPAHTLPAMDLLVDDFLTRMMTMALGPRQSVGARPAATEESLAANPSVSEAMDEEADDSEANHGGDFKARPAMTDVQPRRAFSRPPRTAQLSADDFAFLSSEDAPMVVLEDSTINPMNGNSPATPQTAPATTTPKSSKRKSKNKSPKNTSSAAATPDSRRSATPRKRPGSARK